MILQTGRQDLPFYQESFTQQSLRKRSEYNNKVLILPAYAFTHFTQKLQ